MIALKNEKINNCLVREKKNEILKKNKIEAFFFKICLTNFILFQF